jgi:hypothetical protein
LGGRPGVVGGQAGLASQASLEPGGQYEDGSPERQPARLRATASPAVRWSLSSWTLLINDSRRHHSRYEPPKSAHVNLSGSRLRRTTGASRSPSAASSSRQLLMPASRQPRQLGWTIWMDEVGSLPMQTQVPAAVRAPSRPNVAPRLLSQPPIPRNAGRCQRSRR